MEFIFYHIQCYKMSIICQKVAIVCDIMKIFWHSSILLYRIISCLIGKSAYTYVNAIHVRVLTSVVAGGPIMGLMARGA